MSGLTFRPELAAAVVAGTKTVTRRLCRDNPRSPWWREACAFRPGREYAIQPGRGKPAIGRAVVVSVERQPLGRLTDAEARREGFEDRSHFEDAWGVINRRYDPTAEVWRLELRALPLDGGQGRPCRYCVARVAEIVGADSTIQATVDDCEPWHRDEPVLYDLARAMAKVFAGRPVRDEHVGWYLEDAEDVVDDFDPPPDRWRVRRLPSQANDSDSGIEARLRINDVTYVALAGGKDSRGSVLRLSDYRSWDKEATTSA